MTCVEYAIFWNLANVVWGFLAMIVSLSHACFHCDLCQNMGVLVSASWMLSSGFTAFYFSMFQDLLDQVKRWHIRQWFYFATFQMAIIFFLLFPFIIIKKLECEGIAVDLFYGYVIPIQCIALGSIWLFGFAQCCYRPHALANSTDNDML